MTKKEVGELTSKLSILPNAGVKYSEWTQTRPSENPKTQDEQQLIRYLADLSSASDVLDKYCVRFGIPALTIHDIIAQRKTFSRRRINNT